MYCAKCGKQIPDNAVFCDNCGADQRQKAAVQSSHTHQRAEKPPKQRKNLSGKAKAVISICVVLAIIIGLVAAGLSIYFNSPAREVMEQLDKGKYDKALKIYQNDVSDSTIHNALFKYLLDDELSDKLKAYTEGTLKYEEALPYLYAVVNMEVIDDAGSRLADAISGRCEAIINAYSGGTLSFEAAEEELCFTEEYESLIGITAVTEKHNELIALNKSKENFESGERYFTSGDYEDAIEYFGRVSENSAYYEQAQTMIASAISQYRAEMLDNARSRVQAGDYVGAIALLETALDVISEDAEIAAAIDAYRSEYFATVKNDALTRSTNLSADGDFIQAMEILRNALDIIGDDAELSFMLEQCQTDYEKSIEEEALTTSASLRADGSFRQAINVISDALDSLPGNKALTNAYNACIDEYVSWACAEADKYIEQKDFRGAMAVINEALGFLNTNPVLSQKLGSIEDQMPVSITEALLINRAGRGEWNEGSPVDPFGNDYSDAANYFISRGYNYEFEYRVYGAYSHITFTLAPHSDIRSNGRIYIQIYADDRLVYTSKIIGRKTDAFSANVNITGADYITIKIVDEYFGRLIISDVLLWKQNVTE